MGRKSNAIQKRDEIVWALFDCLAESGHETVTVKHIAARAGLPHGVIHYYFEKKDDIVAALVESITATYVSLFEKAMEGVASPMERVDRMLRYLVEAFVFDRRLNRAFYNLVQMGFEREGVNLPLRRMLGAYRGTTEGIFLEAGAGVKSAPAACLLAAMIEGLALQWMIDPDALDKDSVWRMVEQTVKNLLK
ncbi:MAG: TetR/AcrR family transcriptional regulator [Deltaproteobacteria bacterium]|nr:TetR/AcrR family transcriptional regulator [Deltaproteobacteria bacterium]